jgi:hypothetical protein
MATIGRTFMMLSFVECLGTPERRKMLLGKCFRQFPDVGRGLISEAHLRDADGTT